MIVAFCNIILDLMTFSVCFVNTLRTMFVVSLFKCPISLIFNSNADRQSERPKNISFNPLIGMQHK